MTGSELKERGSLWRGAGWARIWGHLQVWAPNEVAMDLPHIPSQSLVLGTLHPTGELPARLPQDCDSQRAGGRRLWRDNRRRSTSTGQLYSHPYNLPFRTSGHSLCPALRAQISPGQLAGSWPQPLQAVLFLRQPRHSHTVQTKAYGSSPLTHVHQSLPKIPTQEARLPQNMENLGEAPITTQTCGVWQEGCKSPFKMFLLNTYINGYIKMKSQNMPQDVSLQRQSFYHYDPSRTLCGIVAPCISEL